MMAGLTFQGKKVIGTQHQSWDGIKESNLVEGAWNPTLSEAGSKTITSWPSRSASVC